MMKTLLQTSVVCGLFLTVAPVLAQETQSSRTAPQSLDSVTLSFAPVVKEARAAVPLVEATGGDTKSGQGPATVRAAGVVLRPDGFLVTSAAVAERGSGKGGKITVLFEDGRKEMAAVAMIDKRSGLAVLKLKEREEGYPALAIAGPDAVMSGDLYVAMVRKDERKLALIQGVFSEAPGAEDTETSEWVDPDKAAAPFYETGHDWPVADVGVPLIGMDGKMAAIVARPDGSPVPYALPGAAARMLVAIVTGETPTERQEGVRNTHPTRRTVYDGYGLPDWEMQRNVTFNYWFLWGSPWWWDGYWGYTPYSWYWSSFYAPPPPPIIIVHPRPYHDRDWLRRHWRDWRRDRDFDRDRTHRTPPSSLPPPVPGGRPPRDGKPPRGMDGENPRVHPGGMRRDRDFERETEAERDRDRVHRLPPTPMPPVPAGKPPREGKPPRDRDGDVERENPRGERQDRTQRNVPDAAFPDRPAAETRIFRPRPPQRPDGDEASKIVKEPPSSPSVTPPPMPVPDRSPVDRSNRDERPRGEFRFAPPPQMGREPEAAPERRRIITVPAPSSVTMPAPMPAPMPQAQKAPPPAISAPPPGRDRDKPRRNEDDPRFMRQ